VLAKVFAYGLKALKGFDPERGSFGGYVCRIARNCIQAYLARQAGTGRYEIPSEAIAGSAYDADSRSPMLALELLKYLNLMLSDLLWVTFVEICIRETPPKEAAALLKTNPSTLYVRIWKIRQVATQILTTPELILENRRG
jgi:DNA-directed RNA polymerase specialized sigma24 family protein